MEKHFIVSSPRDFTKYKTEEEAFEKAKRGIGMKVGLGGLPTDEYFVYQLIASVKAPVPEAVVTKVA